MCTKIVMLLLMVMILIPDKVTAQTFAVIGDYGEDGGHELAVANMVKGWNPDFIVTVGDNNYDNGYASTIDQNIGKYFHDYIYPYLGSYGSGSPGNINRFFPVPGNHDWDASSLPAGDLTPYLDYFTLPNNERYYDFIWGDVHFFMIDSDDREPDGNLETSAQAIWIKDKMENSNSKWKIVILHHAPYSSSGSSTELQWPFKTWGADAVLAGHKHNYERLTVNGLVYYVNGLGGKSTQSFSTILSESEFRYKDDYGAMLVEATSGNINFSFYSRSSTLIDSYEITDPTPVELVDFSAHLNGEGVELKWKTETEVNNYGFNVERLSSLPGTNWESIGFIEGHGNSNSPKYYNYLDKGIKRPGTHNYRLKQIDNDGSYEYSNIININISIPGSYFLSQNFPNPFNPETKIDFSIAQKQMVTIRVYNSLGQRVAELLNEEKEAGKYSVIFDGSQLTSGIYIYSLETENSVINKKMTLLK